MGPDHTSSDTVFEFWWYKVNMVSMEVNWTRSEAALICSVKGRSLAEWRPIKETLFVESLTVCVLLLSK